MKEVVGFRRFSNDLAVYDSPIHFPSYPVDVRPDDAIKAWVKTLATPEFVGPISVYRISPLGIEIDMTSMKEEVNYPYLEVGSTLDLKVRVGNDESSFVGLIVTGRTEFDGKILIGIRWCQSPLTGKSSNNRRQYERWLCGDGFLPTGIAPNPSKFNDFIYFSVVDISVDGMQLTTSFRNKLLIPGMVLDSIVSFPLVGQISIRLKLINARVRRNNEKDMLVLGVIFVAPDRQVKEAVGQYVMQFGPKVTPELLRSFGLKPKSVASSLAFSFVRTAEEYREVLALRKLAYEKAGKIEKSVTVEGMGDLYDTRSRIFLARHKGKAVGSFRLIFFEPHEETEHERFVKFPREFPRRDEMLNASRLCTHPEYRGSDLLFSLMQYMALSVIQSKKRWMVSGCTPELLKIYQRFGFKGTGICFKHGDLASVEEELVLWDVTGSVTGENVGPVVWNRTYSELYSHLISSRQIEISPMTSLRLKCYSFLKPLIQLFGSGC